MTYHSSDKIGRGGHVPAPTTKICKKCGEERGLEEFNKFKYGKFGVQSYCKACAAKYNKQWHIDNREKRLAKKRQYYIENTEKEKARCRKWNEENKGYHKQWRRDNPEKVAASDNRRRALKLKAAGNYTGREFIELCDTYGNICLACGADDVKLTADHVVPLSKGGSNDIGNIQPLCLSCNCSKGTNVIDFRDDIIER